MEERERGGRIEGRRAGERVHEVPSIDKKNLKQKEKKEKQWGA